MFFNSAEALSQAEQKPPPTNEVNPADPTFGYGNMCQIRKKQGYNSGMGLIFHLVANINPILSSEAPALPPLNQYNQEHAGQPVEAQGGSRWTGSATTMM